MSDHASQAQLPIAPPQSVEVHEVPPAQAPAPTSLPATADVRGLMRLALERGQGMEAVQMLERLVTLEERTMARQAREEFFRALATFQGACPPIPRNKTASIVSESKGTRFQYQYAELPVVAKHIAPYLKSAGLSYKWSSVVAEGPNGGKVVVTCHVRHVNGHEETNDCELPIGTRAGMSDQQKVAAAQTFGERRSLIEGLGLTTADPDLDGADVGDEQPRITAAEATDLQALAEEVQVDQAKFFALLGVASFAEVRAAQYHQAVQMLERRRARHQGGAQ